jgi:hypothetical protein
MVDTQLNSFTPYPSLEALTQNWWCFVIHFVGRVFYLEEIKMTEQQQCCGTTCNKKDVTGHIEKLEARVESLKPFVELCKMQTDAMKNQNDDIAALTEHNRLLNEECEQLKADKAELVEMLTDLTKHQQFSIHLPFTLNKVNDLLNKHKGE